MDLVKLVQKLELRFGLLMLHKHLRSSVVSITVAAMLTSCTPSSHVLVGHSRAAIAPEDVEVYLNPPAHYEEIALLEASSRPSWLIKRQAKINEAVERLKKEAARLGANGILLQETAAFAPNQAASASGIAIFVPEQ